MRTLASVVLLMILTALESPAQKQGKSLIDSLLLEIPRAATDSIKVRIYKQVADAYFFIDIAQALHYSRIGLLHARRASWQRAISTFTMSIGRAYSDKGMIDSCLLYYNQALSMQKKAGDNRNIATTLINMGTAEQNIRSEYTKATQYYFDALEYAEKDKSPYMTASVYDNLSVIYLAQDDREKALQYAFKAMKICETQDGTDRNFMNEWAISVSNIAHAYSALQNTGKARLYYKKALAIYRKTGSIEGLATCYSGLASLPGLDTKSRIEYGLKSKTLWDKINPVNPVAIDNLGNLGVAHLDLARNDAAKDRSGQKATRLIQAEGYLQAAIRLSDQKGAVQSSSYYTGQLSELQLLRGDYKSAYYNLRKYQRVQDSLFSQENKNKIARLESKREIELRDKEIELNKLALETQERQRIGLLLGLALLAMIGVLLFWQNQNRKRMNAKLIKLNSELDAANKIKARFFAILSHDLRGPVANLIHFLHLQKEDPEMLTPQATEKHQQRIAESAESLLENMESMLLWSKGQMQQFEPQKKIISVNELFFYLQKFFSGVDDIAFHFSNPESLHIATDEDYVKVIMQNLTSNAIKALKSTSNPAIGWDARKEDGQIVLTITDNGPGASAVQLAALYTDQESVGIRSGLGLHLVRDLAKAISCSIIADPESGAGMKFRLVFAG